MASRLVLALDETDPARALKVAKEVAPFVSKIKINYPLVLSAGMQIATEISKYSNVICDFKVADIPNTNRLIAESVFGAGASGIIAHAFPGPESLKAIRKVDDSKDLYIVITMSHPKGGDFFNIDSFCSLALEVGATGVIGYNFKDLTFVSLSNMDSNIRENVIMTGINLESQLLAIKKFIKKEKRKKTVILFPKNKYSKHVEKNIQLINFTNTRLFKYDEDPKILTRQIEKLTNYKQRKINLDSRVKKLEVSENPKDIRKEINSKNAKKLGSSEIRKLILSYKNNV